MPMLEGVRVLELSEFAFVPACAAVLADWGAEVVKVERPEGDPMRGLMAAGFHVDTGDFNSSFEHFNRNKRGVAIDLKHPRGRALLDTLVCWRMCS